MGSSSSQNEEQLLEERRRDAKADAQKVDSALVMTCINENKMKMGHSSDLPVDPDAQKVLEHVDQTGSITWDNKLSCFMEGHFMGEEASAILCVVKTLQGGAAMTQDGKFKVGLLEHMTSSEQIQKAEQQHDVSITIGRLRDVSSRTLVEKISPSSIFELVLSIKQSLLAVGVPLAMAIAMAVPQLGQVLNGVKSCINSSSSDSMLKVCDYIAGYAAPGLLTSKPSPADLQGDQDAIDKIVHEGRMNIWAYHAFEYEFREEACSRRGWLFRRGALEVVTELKQVVFHIAPKVEEAGLELAKGIQRRNAADSQYGESLKKWRADAKEAYDEECLALQKFVQMMGEDMSEDDKEQVRADKKVAFAKYKEKLQIINAEV